jgi:hypothetical protein
MAGKWLRSGEVTGTNPAVRADIGLSSTRPGAIRLEHVGAELRRFMLMRISRARSPSSD